MSSFIKLTGVDGASVMVNASKVQSIFPYDNYTGIRFYGCEDILFVKDLYDDMIAAIGAVDIIDVKPELSESIRILCQKSPEPTYADKEIIERLTCDIDKLCDIIFHGDTNANHHGKWVDHTNTDITCEINGELVMINIASARCSECGRRSEQVNVFPPYVQYKRCLNCGVYME